MYSSIILFLFLLFKKNYFLVQQSKPMWQFPDYISIKGLGKYCFFASQSRSGFFSSSFVSLIMMMIIIIISHLFV